MVGEMAQRLRVHSILAEDLGSVTGTHIVAHNHLLTLVSGDQVSSYLFWHRGEHTYMQVKCSCINKSL